HEGERLGKVLERERALDPVAVVAYIPSGCLLMMRLDLLWGERGDPAAARRAGFSAERFGLCGHGAASSSLEKGVQMRSDRIRSRRLEPARSFGDDDLTRFPPFMSKLVAAGPQARAGVHDKLADLGGLRADRRSCRGDRRRHARDPG